MCRAVSVVSICLTHVEMRGDAVAIYLLCPTKDRPVGRRDMTSEPFFASKQYVLEDGAGGPAC
ncbi:unnamed protein product, partial [Phaeothamnion confervicola]